MFNCFTLFQLHKLTPGGLKELIVLNLVLYFISVLVTVAFLTLYERKILGLSQIRLGPAKLGWAGILQPFADAAKLFRKSFYAPYKANRRFFFLAPFTALFVILSLWIFMPAQFNPFTFASFSSLIFLLILRINIYPLIFRGWASNNKLSFFGAIRGMAQTISYEISLALILFSLLIAPETTQISHVTIFRSQSSLNLLLPLLLFLWIFSCVAETNRAPLDFSEGESELVSGFNTEYGGPGFAIIFMAEYGIILFFRVVTPILFFSSPLPFGLGFILFLFFWMWIRSTFPRYRYDILMTLCWKRVLPATLLTITFITTLSFVHYQVI